MSLLNHRRYQIILTSLNNIYHICHWSYLVFAIFIFVQALILVFIVICKKLNSFVVSNLHQFHLKVILKLLIDLKYSPTYVPLKGYKLCRISYLETIQNALINFDLFKFVETSTNKILFPWWISQWIFINKCSKELDKVFLFLLIWLIARTKEGFDIAHHLANRWKEIHVICLH